MSNWWFGFIGGVSATIIGFIFTMTWDIYKNKRDVVERDKVVIIAINEEIKSNIGIVFSNAIIIKKELEVLNEKKTVILPLNVLQTGFWDLLKIHLPSQLNSGDTIIRIRKLAILTNDINEVIRSRENYRIGNAAMSNFIDRLKIYDQVLLDKIKQIVDLYDEVKNEKWFNQK